MKIKHIKTCVMYQIYDLKSTYYQEKTENKLSKLLTQSEKNNSKLKPKYKRRK